MQPLTRPSYFLLVNKSKCPLPMVDIGPIDMKIGLTGTDFFQISAILLTPRQSFQDNEILQRKNRDQ